MLQNVLVLLWGLAAGGNGSPRIMQVTVKAKLERVACKYAKK